MDEHDPERRTGLEPEPEPPLQARAAKEHHARGGDDGEASHTDDRVGKPKASACSVLMTEPQLRIGLTLQLGT